MEVRIQVRQHDQNTGKTLEHEFQGELRRVVEDDGKVRLYVFSTDLPDGAMCLHGFCVIGDQISLSEVVDGVITTMRLTPDLPMCELPCPTSLSVVG